MTFPVPPPIRCKKTPRNLSRAIMLLVTGMLTSLAGAQSASAETPPPPATATVTPPAPPPAEAPHKTSLHEKFFDETDGYFDFSYILAKGGFFPVPVIITKPAVDGGYGLAPVFLTHSPKNPHLLTRRVIAAFETGNGSYGYGYFRAETPSTGA